MNTREVDTSRIEFTTYTGKLPELAKLYGYLDKVLDLCVQHGEEQYHIEKYGSVS